MSINKSSLLIASILVLLVIGSVYTQETATKRQTAQAPQAPQAAQTAQSTQSTQKEKPVINQDSNLKYLIFRQDCLDGFLKGDLNVDCIKFTISKALSLGIIGGSLLYKAPQILKILGSGSVEGLSLTSFYFQFLMVLITIGYNLHIKAPISTYAENLSILVQNIILIVLFWKMSPKTSVLGMLAPAVFFTAVGTVLYMDILPDSIYDGIGVINIVLFVLSVAPQIWLNYKNKSTGQLALVTILLAWGGNLARVFTTMQEVKDPLLLAFFGIGAVLNGTLILQFLIYSGKKETKGKRSKKE